MINIDLSKIKNITSDSRDVDPGSIFVAIAGTKENGHKYIEDAINKGAEIIIHSNEFSPSPNKSNIKFIKVEEPRIVLSELAATIYAPQPNNIVAVTGTNGKTSVAYYFKQIMELLGKSSASIGTLGVLTSNDLHFESTLTTPSTVHLYQILQRLTQNNIDYVAIEASSHGLHQHRLDHIKLKAAAITNFSHEHLDYHKTIPNYFAAKMRLFSELLPEGATAVINADMEEYAAITKICQQRNHRIISYGYGSNQLTIQDIEQHQEYLLVRFKTKVTNYELAFPNIVGNFQTHNILCAIGLVMACGFELNQILPVISGLYSAPGRMQKVENANVFVDYAHKPEALEKTLQVLKNSFSGKIIVVFGCGGDRDKEKRPVMGRIAEQYSDIAIVTDDNPRSENPQVIRQAILQKCKKGIEIGDREKAIKHAIQFITGPNDAVLIAGKGHENYQIIGDKTREFDDYQIAKKYLIP